jgi:hypothetical protein
MARLAQDIRRVTDEARQELVQDLSRGTPRGLARWGNRAARTVILTLTLAMVAAGFAIFASFVFANLLVHINPGL